MKCTHKRMKQYHTGFLEIVGDTIGVKGVISASNEIQVVWECVKLEQLFH